MNLHEYGDMLFRSPRVAAFEKAIARVVRPGMRVLDLGTGLGTYAFFAAKAGAERVTAVEAGPVVHLARAVAARNGLDGGIEFVRARAPDGLHEDVFDVVIFEDYPTTFMDAATWTLLRAVQERHLARDGVLLPGGVRFGVAPVKGAAWEVAPTTAWETRRFGIDWGELRTHLANSGRRVRLPSSALAAGVRPGPRRAIVPLPTPEAIGAESEWIATGEPIVGLAFWFDLDLGEGAWVTNAPGAGREVWGQWLLPVDPPLEAAPGTLARARVWRETLDDGAPGWMGWSCAAGGAERRGHEFAGLPLSLEDLTGDVGSGVREPGPP